MEDVGQTVHHVIDLLLPHVQQRIHRESELCHLGRSQVPGEDSTGDRDEVQPNTDLKLVQNTWCHSSPDPISLKQTLKATQVPAGWADGHRHGERGRGRRREVVGMGWNEWGIDDEAVDEGRNPGVPLEQARRECFRVHFIHPA